MGWNGTVPRSLLRVARRDGARSVGSTPHVVPYRLRRAGQGEDVAPLELRFILGRLLQIFRTYGAGCGADRRPACPSTVSTSNSRRRRWRQAVLPSVVRPPFSVVQLPRSAGGGLVEDQRCSHETPQHWRGAQNFSKKVLHGSGSLLFCQPAFPKLGGGDLTTINRQLLFVWLNVLEFASRLMTSAS